jgi:hypothetical protein
MVAAAGDIESRPGVVGVGVGGRFGVGVRFGAGLGSGLPGPKQAPWAVANAGGLGALRYTGVTTVTSGKCVPPR